MHPCKLQAQDANQDAHDERWTGPPSHSKTTFEGTTVLHKIGYATKCAECHVLREKEELVAMMFGLHHAAENRMASLTPREHQIMKLVLAGHPSKNIAADLGSANAPSKIIGLRS